MAGGCNELKPLCRRGVTEISAAVGVNPKRFNHYVKERGLPAFQFERGGTYVALDEDLKKWLEDQRRGSF